MNESPGHESLMIKYDLNDSQDLNVEWTKVSCGFFFMIMMVAIFCIYRNESSKIQRTFNFVFLGHLWLHCS
jgi:hypothetical protein